jgi:hypothetical protein
MSKEAKRLSTVQEDLDRLDPYNSEPARSMAWRLGFLTGFLTSLFKDSNYIRYQWNQHIERVHSRGD